jgi:hypothetical protein
MSEEYNLLENELWKPVSNFEGYFISSEGRLISRKRGQDKILTGQKKKRYIVYELQNNRRTNILAHILVAENFVDGKSDEKKFVDHIDNDGFNNKASNLRWVTHKENCENRGFVKNAKLYAVSRVKERDVYRVSWKPKGADKSKIKNFNTREKAENWAKENLDSLSLERTPRNKSLPKETIEILYNPEFEGNKDIEIWKDIDGYEGKYRVSNFGNVRSLRGTNYCPMKGTYDDGGYKIVKLTKNGYKHYRVHRLVALHFVHGKTPENIEVDHIDRNPENNHCLNLRWSNRIENNNNKSCVNDDSYMKHLNQMIKPLQESGKSIFMIVKILNDNGIKTKQGKNLYHALIKKCIASCLE